MQTRCIAEIGSLLGLIIATEKPTPHWTSIEAASSKLQLRRLCPRTPDLLSFQQGKSSKRQKQQAERFQKRGQPLVNIEHSPCNSCVVSVLSNTPYDPSAASCDYQFLPPPPLCWLRFIKQQAASRNLPRRLHPTDRTTTNQEESFLIRLSIPSAADS